VAWDAGPIYKISRLGGEGGGSAGGEGYRGGPRKFEYDPFFPCAHFGAKIGPLAITLREINSSLGDPLPLRSMEIENFKRRYLRYLKR